VGVRLPQRPCARFVLEVQGADLAVVRMIARRVAAKPFRSIEL
jgi:hypothetical protein